MSRTISLGTSSTWWWWTATVSRLKMHLLPLLLLPRLKHLQVVFQLRELRVGFVHTLIFQSAPFLTHRVSKQMLINGWLWDIIGEEDEKVSFAR
jgi:hypothetical protein